MRKVDDGKRREKKKEKKRMAFLVATTSLPAVYRPNGYARTTTAGTRHARASLHIYCGLLDILIACLENLPCSRYRVSAKNVSMFCQAQPPVNFNFIFN